MPYNAFVERKIPISCACAFSYLADFGGIGKILPIQLKSVTLKGEGIGSERSLEVHGTEGVIVERLDAILDQRLIVYSIINDSPFPVERYVAVVELSGEGETTCKVRYGGNWVAKGASNAEAKSLLEGFYNAIIDAIVGLESGSIAKF